MTTWLISKLGTGFYIIWKLFLITVGLLGYVGAIVSVSL